MSFFALALALSAPVAEAASYQDLLPMDRLVERADRVIRGDILTTRSVMTDNGIFTIATIAVQETLRGPHEAITEIRIPGGKLNGLELQVNGAPRVIAGDQMLLFLKNGAIVGLSQGAMLVAGDLAWRPGRLGAFSAPMPYREWLSQLEPNGDYEAWNLEDVRSALR